MAKLVRESLNEAMQDEMNFDSNYDKKYEPRKLKPGENTEDIEKIKAFAKENGWEFGLNKNKTAFISMEVSYPMLLAYDQFMWPVIVEELNYTFTYTNWDTPISVRKVWYGEQGAEAGSGRDKFLMYKSTSEKEVEKMYSRFAKFAKDNNLPIKNLKQVLLGRFKTIEEALAKVKSNSAKELKKARSVEPNEGPKGYIKGQLHYDKNGNFRPVLGKQYYDSQKASGRDVSGLDYEE